MPLADLPGAQAVTDRAPAEHPLRWGLGRPPTAVYPSFGGFHVRGSWTCRSCRASRASLRYRAVTAGGPRISQAGLSGSFRLTSAPGDSGVRERGTEDL